MMLKKKMNSLTNTAFNMSKMRERKMVEKIVICIDPCNSAKWGNNSCPKFFRSCFIRFMLIMKEMNASQYKIGFKNAFPIALMSSNTSSFK